MRIQANHRCFLLMSLTLAVFLQGTEAYAQVGVNIFGLSYHYKPQEATNYEAFNPGLGLHWTFDRTANTSLEANLGVYRDSEKTPEYHISFGGRARIWKPIELGLHVIWTQSPSMHWGKASLYPFPFLALRTGQTAFNFIYIPRLGDAWPTTIGAYVTIFPFAEGWTATPVSGPDSFQRHSALEFRLGKGLTLAPMPGLGITWRRYFSPRNALRLGLNLRGQWGIYGNPDTGEETANGSYRATFLIQFLRSSKFTARTGWFWAAGVRLDSGNQRVFLDSKEAVFNLGVDYELGSGFSVLAQYGLKIGGQWLAQGRDPEEQTEWSSFFVKSDGVDIGLVFEY